MPFSRIAPVVVLGWRNAYMLFGPALSLLYSRCTYLDSSPCTNNPLSLQRVLTDKFVQTMSTSKLQVTRQETSVFSMQSLRFGFLTKCYSVLLAFCALVLHVLYIHPSTSYCAVDCHHRHDLPLLRFAHSHLDRHRLPRRRYSSALCADVVTRVFKLLFWNCRSQTHWVQIFFFMTVFLHPLDIPERLRVHNTQTKIMRTQSVQIRRPRAKDTVTNCICVSLRYGAAPAIGHIIHAWTR